MKRLVLRIAALGTVVILGLIAIAQAQRGTEDSPAVAGEVARAQKGPLAASAPRPIPPAAVAGARPLRGKIPSIPEGNPLRKTRQVAAAENVPPAKVLPAKAPSGNQTLPRAAADLTPQEQPTRRPSVDPFGLQNRGGGLPTNPTNGIAAPRESASLAAKANAGPRYPQLPGPPPAAEIPAAAPGTPGAAEASITDRYPGMGRETPGIAEPAPLSANPLGNPTLIPPPSLATSNQFALPAADAASGDLAPMGEGTGQPGSKLLEGPQSPQLTIQKFAPEQIQVGKPATFRVTVRNTGSVAACGVEVRDEIPKGTRLIDTTPRATRGTRGELVWSLGTVKPDDESQVEVRLMPTAEGEIGSVATVSFRADASARSLATKPELVLKTSAPERVLIGEKVLLSIEVSNPGSGTATGVSLEEHIPAGLQHAAGSDLEYEIGDLPPGESRKLELTLTATRAGPVTNVLTARGDANLKAEDRLNMEVIAPLLDVAMDGPQRRYLEREAVYTLAVRNPGTAPAERVELVAYLPSGLKFVSANNAGHYDDANRSVHWRLEELPVNETGTVELTTMPVEAGQQKLRLRGTADKGLQAEEEQQISIEGIAAIKFEVVDVTDPIEVGGETTYEVRVVNQGSKAATNVRVVATLPAEMQAVAAEGPTRYAVDGSRVLFDGLSRLAPKADTTYRIRAKGLRPGDLRVRVQLLTDEMRTPVTKEESTRVYSDQ